MTRNLNDIIADPQSDPQRRFDLIIDKLQETLFERAIRTISENALEFGEHLKAMRCAFTTPIPTQCGVIESICDDGYDLCIIKYRDADTADVLWTLRGSYENLHKFVNGEYPMDTDEFMMGVIEARNTETGEWITGKMPHIETFVPIRIKHVAHGLYDFVAKGVDNWTVCAILDRDQVASWMGGGPNWSEMLKLCYKIVKPNDENLRNCSADVTRRNWKRYDSNRSLYSRGISRA